MRNRLMLLGALVAMALSSAPAQAPSFWPDGWGSECDSLLPSYWQDPDKRWCPSDRLVLL